MRGIEVPGPSSTEVVIVNEGGAGLGGDCVEVDGSSTGADDDEVSGALATAGAADEEAAGALKYKCTIEPSEMSYSLSSFESVNALPLSKSRCESGGGADDDELAMDCLSCATESVMLTVMGKESDGLRDLTVMLTVASENQRRPV